jgi:hypothetical protein
VSHDTAPATLVAAAAILVAAIGLRATTLAGDATGTLESAVRVEVKQGAADAQDALVVFDEAPFAARAAAARFRSEELAREAETTLDRTAKQQLTVEAVVAGVVARSLGGGTDGDEALAVDRRLAERRAQQSLGPEAADALAEQGDDTGRRAALIALAAAPAGLAFLLGSLGQAFRRGRLPLVCAGVVALLVAVAGAVWVEVAA